MANLTIPTPPATRPSTVSFRRSEIKAPPPVNGVDAAFTETAMRMQQLGVLQMGEKMLRERQSALKRALKEAEKKHELSLMALQAEADAEVNNIERSLRFAKLRRETAVKEVAALRSRRTKLEHQLGTIEGECDEKVEETQREVAQVMQRLLEVQATQTQLEASRAELAEHGADGSLLQRLQETEDRAAALRVAVQTGQDYVEWVQEHLAACQAVAHEGVDAPPPGAPPPEAAASRKLDKGPSKKGGKLGGREGAPRARRATPPASQQPPQQQPQQPQQQPQQPQQQPQQPQKPTKAAAVTSAAAAPKPPPPRSRGRPQRQPTAAELAAQEAREQAFEVFGTNIHALKSSMRELGHAGRAEPRPSPGLSAAARRPPWAV
eukprot:Transcript_16097.p1 GENE.Transcript_16097~~Transcript_16097.p1  ORF type:complete len:379 (-),score=143.66 Transcript_16097:564-1700(-)